VSELYEYVQGVFLIKALIAVAMSPRKPTFNVTAKGLSLDNDHLSELSWPFFALWGLLIAAGVTAAWRYMFDPGANSLMLVVGSWNAFNLLIAGAALGAVSERKQPDRHPRLGIDREGVLVMDGGKRYPVKVLNVSAGGCGFNFLDDAPEKIDADELRGRLFVKPLPGAAPQGQGLALPLTFKRMTTEEGKANVGAEFDDLRPREYYVLAELMYGDSDALPRFLKSRRKHKNLFAGFGVFMWWGVSEPIRALSYAFKGKVETAENHTAPDPSKTGAEAVPTAVKLEAHDVSTEKLRQMLDLAAAQLQEAEPLSTGAATRA
jgi:cellulose synthase (UDP-forming)